MLIQSLCTTGMTQAASTEIGTAMPDGKVVSFHEGSIQCIGILGVEQTLFQRSFRSHTQFAIHSNHAIAAAFLDHLAVDTDISQEPSCRPFIDLESIGCKQETTLKLTACR